MAQLFTNNAWGTLKTQLAQGATSLVLDTGQGARFPSPSDGDYFLATLIGLTGSTETSWEIVKCTARSTDTLTVTRAQESTSDTTWPVGTRVELRVTKGFLATLGQMSPLAPTDSNIIVGDGSKWVAETGATARTSLGLGTGDSPQFTGINVGHATDTTLTRSAAGVVAVEGVDLASVSGTQTLTNKTISSDNNTLSGLAASSFVLSNASGNIDGAASQKAIPAGAVVGTTDTQTLTNKTLTSPKVGTSVLDANGNELVKLTATANAVNEFTVANAAAGANPTLSVTGDDANIGMTLAAKGTGKLLVGPSFLIDSSGYATMGYADGIATSNSTTHQVQLATTSVSGPVAHVSCDAYRTDTYGGHIRLRRSRNTTVGAHAAVQSGDELGRITVHGSDGSNFTASADIGFRCDGAVASLDVPGAIVFQTKPSGAVIGERMRITSAGLVGVNTNAPTGQLHVRRAVSGPPLVLESFRASPVFGCVQQMRLSKTDTLGAHATVAENDTIGTIQFSASDGTDFRAGVELMAMVDGAVAADSMPMRLALRTRPSGAGAVTTERVTIKSDGKVGIGTTLPGYLLSVAGLVGAYGYCSKVYTIPASGTDNTAPALSPANGGLQIWVLSDNATPTAGTWNEGESLILFIDDGSARTITWTSVPVTWLGGSAPTINTTGYTYIELFKLGTTIYGIKHLS